MAAPVYTDFNIGNEDGSLKQLISLAVKLGYERVAVNNFITDLKGGKKQKDKVSIASPRDIKLNETELNSLHLHGKKLEQLSRLTATLEDASNTHRLSSPEVQAYDILAVQPTDEKTFQLACSTLEVDIITFNLSEHLGFVLKRPLLKLAAERGIHFEITYSPALQNSSVKRQILANAMNLVEFARGKNVILASGANKPLSLRSPYDVVNLAKIFGLDHVQAMNSITRNCRNLLMHAVFKPKHMTTVEYETNARMIPMPIPECMQAKLSASVVFLPREERVNERCKASRKSCKSVISAHSICTLSNKDKWILDVHSKMMDMADSESGSDNEVDVSNKVVTCNVDTGIEPEKKRRKT